MEKFKKYLILSQIVPENKAQFYVNWVSKFYFACKKDPTAAVTQKEINGFLTNLSNIVKNGRSTKHVIVSVAIHSTLTSCGQRECIEVCDSIPGNAHIILFRRVGIH